MFATAVVAPLTDIGVGAALGFPSPFLSLVVLGVAVLVRRRALRTARERPAPLTPTAGE